MNHLGERERRLSSDRQADIVRIPRRRDRSGGQKAHRRACDASHSQPGPADGQRRSRATSSHPGAGAQKNRGNGPGGIRIVPSQVVGRKADRSPNAPLHDGGTAYPPARCRLPAAISFAGPTHRLATVPGIGGTGNGAVPHTVDAVDRPGSPTPSATPFFGQAALVGFTVFRSCTSRTWLRAAG